MAQWIANNDGPMYTVERTTSKYTVPCTHWFLYSSLQPFCLINLSENSLILYLHHKHTHTHTHPFNGPLSRTTRVSRYQKGKTNLDFTEARDSGISWAICKSAPCSRQITMPTPHHSVFYRPDAFPAAQTSLCKCITQQLTCHACYKSIRINCYN